MNPTAYVAHLRKTADDFVRDLDDLDTFSRLAYRSKAESYRLIAEEIERQLDEWSLVPEDESGYEAMFTQSFGAAA